MQAKLIISAVLLAALFGAAFSEMLTSCSGGVVVTSGSIKYCVTSMYTTSGQRLYKYTNMADTGDMIYTTQQGYNSDGTAHYVECNCDGSPIDPSEGVICL